MRKKKKWSIIKNAWFHILNWTKWAVLNLLINKYNIHLLIPRILCRQVICHLFLLTEFLISMTVFSSSAVTACSLISFAMTVNMQRVASSIKSETSNQNNNVNTGLVSILLETLRSKTSIFVFLFSSVIFVVNFLFFHLTTSGGSSNFKTGGRGPGAV